jgi:bacterioferritin
MGLDKQEIINTPNYDISLEHQAILGYLTIAYVLGEGEVAAALETLAREEMLHLKWLCWAVTDQGGVPTLDPPQAGSHGGTPVEMLKTAVQHEVRIIADYEQQMVQIDDVKIKRLLQRLIEDSKRHRETVLGIIAGLEAEQATSSPPVGQPIPENTGQVIRLLNDDVREEYTAILQYLWQYFTARHCPFSKRFEDTAIQEMKHLGWLSEMVAELSGEPKIVPGRVNKTTDLVEALEADIGAERMAQQMYQQHINAIDEPEVQKLLGYIRQHEVFHEGTFSNMLAEVTQPADEEKAPAAARPGPTGKLTVGSLIRS